MTMEAKCFKISLAYLCFVVVNIVGTSALSTVRDHCVDERPVCDKKSDADSKTRFFLYTRRNKLNPEPLHKCYLTLPDDTYFNASNPTKIVVHGFLQDLCIVAWMLEMKEELLKREDSNVILLDWTYYSQNDYVAAVRSMKDAVREAAELINNLKHQNGVDFKNLHIIGHSLGSHFAGLLGQETEMYRITGLDPAGPAYYNLPDDKKLSRDDAKFVDVIHSNSGRCLPFFGITEPLGDEDFYVEGGSIQPSCYNMALESLLKLDTGEAVSCLVIPVLCYHMQAVYFFKSSINAKDNCCFLGKRCNSYEDAMMETNKCKQKCCKSGKNCSIMGMDWQQTYKKKLQKRRTYTVKASNICPYCTECASEIPKILQWQL